jgi:2-polyprenyl-3-methyl-5-hydroxy-6-metoxy-1,4-benzoquinol methylase
MPVAEVPTHLHPSTEVVSILRCTICRKSLRTQEKGELICLGCERVFPAPRGVTRFVGPQNYANSFGFQWHRYDRTQLDHDEIKEAEIHFRMKTGFGPEDLKGKLVLDVGCGMGRFAEVATRWGARVVGVDLSAAAEVAARNLATRDFTAFQADVFFLPFAPESFDYIYSIGVLHHTPDCEKAVKVLPQYLKPGGRMAVWLYSRYSHWYRFSDIYRKYTHRMSADRLHGVLKVAVPFFYQLDRGLRAIPLVGKPVAGVVHHLFPVNRHADPETRVLNTFDWYSPKYQSKHTYEQVFRWFEDCGLQDLHVGESPIAVWGRKPA